MSNAFFIEAFVVGYLLLSFGCWMHFMGAGTVERETRAVTRRIAIVCQVFALAFSFALLIQWSRLDSLHTLAVRGAVGPIFVDAALAAFAVAETGLTLRAALRRRLGERG
jgi:hypothetical protein